MIFFYVIPFQREVGLELGCIAPLLTQFHILDYYLSYTSTPQHYFLSFSVELRQSPF